MTAFKGRLFLGGVLLCLTAPALVGMAVGPGESNTKLPTAAAVQTAPQRSPLVWGAKLKEYHAKSGETNVHFAFSVTNTGPTEVVITDALTSCGCVVATLPEYPWRLAAGTNGLVQVIADLRGKRGLLHKTVDVHTAEHGIQSLAIKVHIPDAVPEVKGDRGTRQWGQIFAFCIVLFSL